MFFSNSLVLSGDFNTSDVIDESINLIEKELWKKSEICRSEEFIEA